jgi:pantetheine-phosphate adenylyltransferase
MKEKIAVYPGSFDPLTNGHIDIIKRTLPFFDKLYVIVAVNSSKHTMFSISERERMIQEFIKQKKLEEKVLVKSFEGLVVNCAKELGAKAIIRGLRAVSDFDYEFQMATMNRNLASDIESIFFTTRGKYFYLSSSTVKEVARNRGDVSSFVPKHVEKMLKESLGVL